VLAAAAAAASTFTLVLTFSEFSRKCRAARVEAADDEAAEEEEEDTALLAWRARADGAADDAESKSAGADEADEVGDVDRDTGAEPAPPLFEPCNCC
jgi:hypothetical protein